MSDILIEITKARLLADVIKLQQLAAKKIEFDLTSDGAGQQDHQSNYISLVVCRSCGVAHQGRCELRELTA